MDQFVWPTTHPGFYGDYRLPANTAIKARLHTFTK